VALTLYRNGAWADASGLAAGDRQERAAGDRQERIVARRRDDADLRSAKFLPATGRQPLARR
jgi:hypothetical protein